MALLKIYTDGACSNNQGTDTVGGWGAILEYGEHRKELHGGEADTTNNRMELTAVIEALSALKGPGNSIDLFSDSSYVMNCFREKWYVKWQKNGWVNSKKEPVENRDLWEKLIALVSEQNINFYRVKGHVNPEAEDAKLKPVYEKFREMNGDSFTFDEFRHVTVNNNRADELANMGIDEVRASKAQL